MTWYYNTNPSKRSYPQQTNSKHYSWYNSSSSDCWEAGDESQMFHTHTARLYFYYTRDMREVVSSTGREGSIDSILGISIFSSNNSGKRLFSPIYFESTPAKILWIGIMYTLAWRLRQIIRNYLILRFDRLSQGALLYRWISYGAPIVNRVRGSEHRSCSVSFV